MSRKQSVKWNEYRRQKSVSASCVRQNAITCHLVSINGCYRRRIRKRMRTNYASYEKRFETMQHVSLDGHHHPLPPTTCVLWPFKKRQPGIEWQIYKWKFQMISMKNCHLKSLEKQRDWVVGPAPALSTAITVCPLHSPNEICHS